MKRSGDWQVHNPSKMLVELAAEFMSNDVAHLPRLC